MLIFLVFAFPILSRFLPFQLPCCNLEVTGYWHFALLPDIIWILLLQYMQLLLVGSLGCKEGSFPPFCIFISRTLSHLLSSCSPPHIYCSEEWELVTPLSQVWRVLWGVPYTHRRKRDPKSQFIQSCSLNSKMQTWEKLCFCYSPNYLTGLPFLSQQSYSALSSRPTSVMCPYPNSGLFVLAPAAE